MSYFIEVLLIRCIILFPEIEASKSISTFKNDMLDIAEASLLPITNHMSFFSPAKEAKSAVLYCRMCSAAPTLVLVFHDSTLDEKLVLLPKTWRSRPRGFGGVPPKKRLVCRLTGYY
jgi:hypothetical protein